MTIQWCGQSWVLRDSTTPGGPGFGLWSQNNVIQNLDGTLTIKLTNPSGTRPIGCELSGTKSLGYGTYTITVDGQLNNLDKNVVLGNLFPYFGGSPYVEFDVGEVSSWDGNGIVISHTSYVGLNDKLSNSKAVDSGTSHKFVFKWEPGKATYDTYKADGTLFLHTEHTMNFATPGSERPLINLWAFSTPGQPLTADDLDCPGVTFVLRDFSFVALGQPIPDPTPIPPTPSPTPDINKAVEELRTELVSQQKLSKIKIEAYNTTHSTSTRINEIKKLL